MQAQTLRFDPKLFRFALKTQCQYSSRINWCRDRGLDRGLGNELVPIVYSLVPCLPVKSVSIVIYTRGSQPCMVAVGMNLTVVYLFWCGAIRYRVGELGVAVTHVTPPLHVHYYHTTRFLLLLGDRPYSMPSQSG